MLRDNMCSLNVRKVAGLHGLKHNLSVCSFLKSLFGDSSRVHSYSRTFEEDGFLLYLGRCSTSA